MGSFSLDFMVEYSYYFALSNPYNYFAPTIQPGKYLTRGRKGHKSTAEQDVASLIFLIIRKTPYPVVI